MALDKTTHEVAVQGELDLLEPKAENPFLDGFRVPLRGKRTAMAVEGRNEQLIDVETGLVSGVSEVVKREIVDSDKFLKVFRAQMAVFFGLSAPGMKVLTACWIEAAASPGKDLIMLSERIAAQHAKHAGHKLSRATYFRGRKDLIEAGIIAPSEEPNAYWVNPAVFFNGDRVKLVSEIVRAPQIAAPGEGFDD